MPVTRRGPSSERVERICADERDARSLRLRLLDELRRGLGLDAYVWLLTDPRTTVGCDPLADVPCLPELPRLVRAKYLTGVGRWTAPETGRPAWSLQESTGGDPARSLIWREVLSRYGITDVGGVVFADRHGCWGFLDVWRAGPSGRFRPDELDRLARLATPVTAALRRCQAATFDAAPVHQRSGSGPAVLLLDDDLAVRSGTAAAAAWLARLVPPVDEAPAVPAIAYNVAAQLLAQEHGVDGHPASARVHLARGFWLTARAARLGSGDGVDGGGIAVTLEETSPLDRLDVFTRSHALTARETELVELLATGTDTREIARRLVVSEHTVQDHLKSVFAKTGARTRRTLLSRALGSRAPDAGPPS